MSWFLALFALVWSSLLLARAEEPAGEPAEEPAAEEAEEAPPPVRTAPDQVLVGVHVNDVQSIDLTTHTYALDAYIWFRWTYEELDPATSMEFINPSEQWGHMLTPNYEEPEALDGGGRYQAVRVTGRFSRKLPLYSYPFDRQVLTMVFEDSVSDVSGLRYALDKVTLNPELSLPGFVIGEPRLVVSDFTHPTSFGDPRTPQGNTYSRATVEIPIHRPFWPYAAKLLLPVVAVILCAALMMLLAPSYVDSRVGVGTTSLLTIVALQMSFNDNLPEVGYLTLMDKIYLLSYGYVIVGLGVVVRTTRMLGGDGAGAAVSLHRRALVALTAVWMALVAGLIVAAVRAG